MERQIYESVKLVLDRLGIGISGAIDAFSRWAYAELIICLVLGLLAGVSLFVLVRILPKYLKGRDEVAVALVYIAGVTIFLVLGVLFLDQLFVAVKAMVSPKAYAIMKLLSLIK